jgi:hypothetical protein
MRKLRGMSLRKTDPLIYIGCHLQLRQIAREVCRGLFEPEADDDLKPEVTHPMFPQLQWRYPVPRKPGEEPQYVLFDEMTEDVMRFNCKRLRYTGRAMLQHADALEAAFEAREAAKRATATMEKADV